MEIVERKYSKIRYFFYVYIFLQGDSALVYISKIRNARSQDHQLTGGLFLIDNRNGFFDQFSN